jgi:hypothetical protein
MSAAVLSGCHSSKKESTSPPPADKSDDGTMTGRVVSEPPPAGQANIERWRFQPDGQPKKYLRLTRAQMQEAIPPEAKEIKLDPWAGKKIRMKYQRADDTWVWGAEVLDKAK